MPNTERQSPTVRDEARRGFSFGVLGVELRVLLQLGIPAPDAQQPSSFFTLVLRNHAWVASTPRYGHTRAPRGIRPICFDGVDVVVRGADAELALQDAGRIEHIGGRDDDLFRAKIDQLAARVGGEVDALDHVLQRRFAEVGVGGGEVALRAVAGRVRGAEQGLAVTIGRAAGEAVDEEVGVDRARW